MRIKMGVSGALRSAGTPKGNTKGTFRESPKGLDQKVQR